MSEYHCHCRPDDNYRCPLHKDNPMTNPTDLEALAAKLELIKGPQAWLERWASHVGNCVGGSYCSCGLTMARMEIDTVLTALTALRAQDAVPAAWMYRGHLRDILEFERLPERFRASYDSETPLYTHPSARIMADKDRENSVEGVHPSPNPAPQAVAAPKQDAEVGWLIEHEDEPKWFTLKPGEAAYQVCWTTESTEALRFARRVDADDYATTFMDEGPIRITEHIWDDGRAHPQPKPDAPAEAADGELLPCPFKQAAENAFIEMFSAGDLAAGDWWIPRLTALAKRGAEIALTGKPSWFNTARGLEELTKLYNHTDSDEPQFTRWQMIVAMQHGAMLTRPTATNGDKDAVIAELNSALRASMDREIATSDQRDAMRMVLKDIEIAEYMDNVSGNMNFEFLQGIARAARPTATNGDKDAVPVAHAPGPWGDIDQLLGKIYAHHVIKYDPDAAKRVLTAALKEAFERGAGAGAEFADNSGGRSWSAQRDDDFASFLKECTAPLTHPSPNPAPQAVAADGVDRLPYKGDVIDAVQTLLERDKAYVDEEGYLVSGLRPADSNGDKDAETRERALNRYRRWCKAQNEIEALTTDNAALREALTSLRDYGCPVCNGDCGSANPPVTECPMRNVAKVLRETKP